MINTRHAIQVLLESIVMTEDLHALWLNTLSFLENMGARKIARSEHPTLVKEVMLKHAAEEFRHAHYLKRQIKKVTAKDFETYSFILGGCKTRRYFDALELKVVRILKKLGVDLRLAYYFVTYAIELRASEIYPLYDEILKKSGSRVLVRSIVLEEQDHLNEMVEEIRTHSFSECVLNEVLPFEEILFKEWLEALNYDVTKLLEHTRK